MALVLQEISEISHRDAQLAEALRKIQAAVNAQKTTGLAGPQGLPGAAGAAGAAGLLNVVQLDKLSLTADLPLTTIATPGSNGFYRLDVRSVLTVKATTSSTLPNAQVFYKDGDTGTQNSPTVGSANTGNTVGNLSEGEVRFYAQAGQVIQVSTSNYASSPAGMTFNARFRLEGPF